MAAPCRPCNLTAASRAASSEWTSWSAMRFSSEVATRLVVRYVPTTPRITISSRKGRMIWVRIFRVGIVRRPGVRGLANTVPTLGRDRIGGIEEDQLVGAAVLGGKRIRCDRVRARVAGVDPDRRLGRHARS